MNTEEIAAVLAHVLMQTGDVRVPFDTIEAGLPDNKVVRVSMDHGTSEMVVHLENEELVEEDG